MAAILVCWIGATDLRATTEPNEVGIGPIGQAVKAQNYTEIALLYNYDKEKVTPYIEWLQKQTANKITTKHEPLSSPINFGPAILIMTIGTSDRGVRS